MSVDAKAARVPREPIALAQRNLQGITVTSDLLRQLHEVLDIPMSTLILISVMCSAAMYFIREHLVIPALVFVLGPIIIMLSAVVNLGLTKLEYFPLQKYDQWLICTITSATIGIVLGLCFVALMARYMDKSEAKSSRFHRA